MINQFQYDKKIQGVNKIGLITLIKREVFRFLNVYTQTIVAPIITTLMFYTVFALAFGGIHREINGISFLSFLAPGLIIMTMVQNAFANTSSSLVIAKVQGNIIDVLMPPLSALEIFTGYILGAVARGLVVGIGAISVLWLFAPMTIHSAPMIILFAILGTYMLGCLGIVGGIWSEKFDHIAAVTNFVVTPMTFLSGTFYSIKMLPPIWQNIASFNPFFYMIDGFRYGFTGQADSSIIIGLVTLFIVNICLSILAYRMIKTGYKIKS